MFTQVGKMFPLLGPKVFTRKIKCFHYYELCFRYCEKEFYSQNYVFPEVGNMTSSAARFSATEKENFRR